MSAKSGQILSGLHALGVSLGQSLPELIGDEDSVAVFANQIIDLRNEILATEPRPEFLKVLDGFLSGIGYAVDSDGRATLID